VTSQLRAEYDLYRHAAWVQAERDCNGYLLSEEGRAAGIEPERLWEIPWEKAVRFASEELLDWWGVNGAGRAGGPRNGRWTWTEYREQAERGAPAALVGAEPYPKTFYAPRIVVRHPDGTEHAETLQCPHMEKWGHTVGDAACQCARQIAAQRGLKVA
jgi:hypothetical protein